MLKGCLCSAGEYQLLLGASGCVTGMAIPDFGPNCLSQIKFKASDELM